MVSADKEKNDPLNGVTIQQIVVYDENNIKVTANSLEYVKYAGPSIIFTVENNRSENIEISLEPNTSAVNNLMVSTFGRSGDYDEFISANSTEQFSFGFSKNDLSYANITILKNLEFTLVFEIFSNTDDSSIYYDKSIQLTTTADSSFIQTYNDNGTVIYEDENVRIVYLGLKKGEFDSTKILFFCDNKSDRTWYIDTQKDTYLINGYNDIGYGISFWISPHHKQYDHITVNSDDFDDYGFEKLETLELVFEFSIPYTSDAYDYTSPHITIPLN